jgi:acetyl esterase/lipase
VQIPQFPQACCAWSPTAQVRHALKGSGVGMVEWLASTAEARLFADRLRSVSRNPVVYAELPGAQHAWDIFCSVRAMESVHAVTRR